MSNPSTSAQKVIRLSAAALSISNPLLPRWSLVRRVLSESPPNTRSAAHCAAYLAADYSPDGFAHLAEVFDDMLAEVKQNAEQQQRFAANAAHELRTPLAATRAMLDVARTVPTDELPEVIERLRAVNDHAVATTEALFLLSTADIGTVAWDPVDLSLAVEETVEDLSSLADSHGVALRLREYPVEAPVISGSATLLRQMTANLVHNAILHNLTDDSGQVWIGLTRRAGRWVLEVSNTGMLVDQELVAHLTEPFFKGAGRVQDDNRGAGLGLSVVSMIVRAHQAMLDLRPRPGGGLVVQVIFSAADPHRS